MPTVRELKSIVRGNLIQGIQEAQVAGVSIDSRSMTNKSIFIAIKGSKFDGHHFIRCAIRQGARVVIASKPITCSSEIAVICVGDTTKALGHIARWHRDQYDIPVIAITGSVGKTTTKEMVSAVLSRRFKVLKNAKTENNQYGVPLTLLKLNPSHKMVVIEWGTNQPGDIRWLAQMVRPTTAIFTNIGESHLQRLKDKNGVFREKAQLIKYLDEKGTLIINGDDPYLKKLLKRYPARKILCFGHGGHLDCQVSWMGVEKNSRILFKVQKKLFSIKSPAVHNVVNALAAICCGRLYKIGYNDVQFALSRFKFGNARQEIINSGGLWIIDDTYNSNPTSLISAVSTLNTFKVGGKRMIVCADMLELGERARLLHQSAGKLITDSSADMVLTVGEHSKHITRFIKNTHTNVKAWHFQNLGQVHKKLKQLCCPGDVLLVKGSRSTRMERTVKFLKEDLWN